MLPEQQQRILGYFIEEARDHLNTIEQGLLNLQGTLDDSEMINEVFRAAHSVKGGAAMLGLGSIQKASHRLEDCFKLLKENSNIQIDQKLESLFLSASDTLKALLEHLQGPFGLSEEKAAELISESEPTFKSLQEHLDSLIEQAEKNTSSSGAQSKGVGKEDSSAVANASVSSSKENLKQIQNQVLQVLREMLQLFKQQATSENREQLQQCTDKLAEIGKEENVTNWYNLCQSAKSAIANPDNTYLVLAKIVITEIKSALELLQAQKDSEIAVSEQLKALIPEIELLEISSSLDIFDTLESGNESHENITLSNVEQVASKDSEELIFDEEVTSVDEPEVSENISSLLDLDISGQFDPDQFYDDEDDLDLTGIDTGGPEVGVAELNTLADLFEGESPDLERSWTEENTVERSTPDKKQVESVEDISTDTEDELIKDFLSVEDNKSDQEQESEPSKDELTLVQLFGDFLDEEDFGSDSPSLGASDTKDNANINLFTDSKVTGNGELDVDVDVDSILGAPSDIDEDDNLDLEVDLEVDLNTTTDRDSLLIDEELSLSEVGNLEELQPDPIDKIPLDEFIGGNETNSLNNFQPDLLEDVSFADEVLPSVQTSSEDISNTFDVIEENQEKDIEQPTTSNLDSDLAEDRVIPQAVEEDFVQELEAGCSNLDNNIFSDISDRQINNENDSFDLADIDIDFDLEDKLDLDVLEDDTNDLFGDITSVPSDIFSSDRGKYKVSPQQMRGLSGSPEALESTPEFTNLNTEERTTKSLEENLKQINSKDLSSDVSLDNFESSSDETLQDLFADLPTVAFEEQENNTDNFLLESKDDIDDLFRSDSAVEDNIAIKNIPEASIPEVNIPEISTPEISSLEDISDSLSLETELEYNSGEQEAPIDDLFRLDSAVEDNIAIKNIPEASIPETSIPEVSIPEISSLEDISDSLNLETELEYNSGEQEAPIDDLFRLDSAVEDNIAIENIPEASIPEVNSLEDISDSLNLETELEYNSEEQEAPIDDLFRLDSAVEDNIAIENIPETSTPEASISEVSTPEASIPEISSLEDISDSLSLETELEYNSGEQEAPIDDLFRLDSSNQKIDAVAVDLLDTLTDIPNNNFEEIALPQSEEDDIFQNLEADTNISSKPKINIDTHIQTSEETVFQELETEFDIPEMQFDEEFSSELLDNSEEYDENLQISFDISEESISNSENFEKSNLEESVSDNSSNIGIEAAFLSNTFLKEETTPTEATSDLDFNTVENQFDELESLLNENETPALESELESKSDTPKDEDFAALEALLDEDLSLSQLGNTEDNNQEKLLADNEDEFSDLQKLLDEVDKSIPNSPSTQVNRRNSIRRAARERTMKVPVKHLDDMSNLVGELVVNRNTLEQDQERLRQFLDNLLHQIQQLSDVGARMQELYERSLLEASLLASKNNDAKSNRNTDRGFNELEMDRFTPFHTLSQEMIELIVRVRESSSDIEFVTEETERVARQFRQVTTQLQEGLTRSRMVPFAEATDRLKRGVRDNAIKCGKQVELVIEGQDTLIDKMILEHLTNPLTHMLNNAIAHGIETPEKRIAKG
ncbi:MAG: Hpt domain-containing protein, partial [Cyanobacteria bacterium P01_A01_bin.45]